MDFRADEKRPDLGRRYTPPATTPRRLVRCATCGRTEPVSALDLAGYTQSGWPRCCGDVMTYYLESELPPDRD